MNRVYATIERPNPALVARFDAIKFEIFAALVPASQLMDPAIKPLANRDWLFAGPAVTVAPDGTDNLMGYAAVGVAKPGDVIVVAAGGDCSAFVWGGGLSLSAQNAGCTAVVVDGAVIDAHSILRRGLPVFCRTATFAQSTGNKPGSVNIPVTCGGVTVHPGDLVLGDLDGIIVIPKADLEDIITVAEERAATIRAIAADLEATKRTLFDIRDGRKMMRDAGVEWID